MCPPQPPKPETTLAIILGASKWPYFTEFQPSPSFRNSAEDFSDYLLDENGFGIPSDNLCYLFDTPRNSVAIISEISRFLHERFNQSLDEEQLPKDLIIYYIIYYVGHGGFRDSTSEYYLAVRSTQRPDLYLSSIPILSLASAIKEESRFHVRRYIILDSCFSAAAYESFQSAPIEVAYKKITEALPEDGTALLCSSGPREPSKAPPDLEHTMFTEALIEVLRHGDKNAPALFSIQDLHNLIRHVISNKFKDEAVRPEIHAPEQRHGNVLDVPLFPNPAKRQMHIPVLFNDKLDVTRERNKKINKKNRIAAILPVFNEEVSVGGVVLRAKRYVDRVIVIDDGSSDRTAEVAELAGAEVIQHLVNRGRGAALKTGFESINGEQIIVTIYGDGQYDPSDIPKLVGPILKGEADMVIGSRPINSPKKDTPFYRRLGQIMLDNATRLESSLNITDSQSGFRAFAASTIGVFRFEQNGQAIESEMLFEAANAGLRIKEVEIGVSYDVASSSENPVSHGMRVLLLLLSDMQLRRPLFYFTVPGIVFTIIGLVLGLVFLQAYYRGATLQFGPTLLMVMCTLIGSIMVVTGIILHTTSRLIQDNGNTRLIMLNEFRKAMQDQEEINACTSDL